MYTTLIKEVIHVVDANELADMMMELEYNMMIIFILTRRIPVYANRN